MSQLEAAAPNREATEAWNTVLFDKFVRFRHIVTRGLAVHGDRALARHAPHSGMRAMDVGCGFGDTTFAIAEQLGAGGEAVGVDTAERFIAEAARDAKERGVTNARFVAADVQTADLGGPFDFAFARFGTMFFASPLAAMRNVRRAMKPGAPLCIVVWRKREDNEWMHIAERIVRAIVPEPEKRDDAPTCGPGPFSMAGADTTSDILLHAGFHDITFERSDAPILIGRDVDDAIEFALALGPAGEIMRLAGADGEKLRPRVVTALRDALASHLTSDGVRAGSSAWIVTARA